MLLKYVKNEGKLFVWFQSIDSFLQGVIKYAATFPKEGKSFQIKLEYKVESVVQNLSIEDIEKTISYFSKYETYIWIVGIVFKNCIRNQASLLDASNFESNFKWLCR